MSPLHLSVELGMGEGALNLRSFWLNKLDLKMGVSDIVVNLTGKWKQDLDVNILGGVCSATLLVPRDVGIRIKDRGFFSTINASGLVKRGNVFVNEAFGHSELTLRVYFFAAVGELNLEML